MADILRALLAVLVLSATVAPAGADAHGTREEAVAMVKRVQQMFALQGAEATFAAVSDPSTPEFHDRDLYVFVHDLNGLNVAHGARPALIGKNLISLKDQDGKHLIREMIEVATGPRSGWVEYKWPHPTTNRIEDKSSYIERMGDYFVGVGVHRK